MNNLFFQCLMALFIGCILFLISSATVPGRTTPLFGEGIFIAFHMIAAAFFSGIAVVLSLFLGLIFQITSVRRLWESLRYLIWFILPIAIVSFIYISVNNHLPLWFGGYKSDQMWEVILLFTSYFSTIFILVHLPMKRIPENQTDFEKFSGKNEGYAKYRPSYPVDCIDYLSDELGIQGAVIADIGSGTGIFARLLAPIAKCVYAVEPNRDMRKSLQGQSENLYAITILEGTAENTTLPAQSVDFVTAAQAFHWFDEKAFQKECQRILKPGGKVVLVWNSLDIDNPVIIGIKALCEKLGLGYTGFNSGMLVQQRGFQGFFKNEAFTIKLFPNKTVLSKDAFIGRHLSSSYAPREDDRNHKAFIEGLGELFEQNKNGDRILLPYWTRVYAGEV